VSQFEQAFPERPDLIEAVRTDNFDCVSKTIDEIGRVRMVRGPEDENGDDTYKYLWPALNGKQLAAWNAYLDWGIFEKDNEDLVG
jgi:hypothetical protein